MHPSFCLSVVVALVGLALTSCVTTQTGDSANPQYIDAIQPGDQRLSCDDLKVQIAQMDAHIREADRVEAQRKQDGTSDMVGGTAAGSVVPYGGLLHMLAVTRPKNDEWVTVRERGSQAARRKEHVVTLYNQKDCPGPVAPARS
jgi:hypothetical protein